MITLLPWVAAAFAGTAVDELEYNRLLGPSDDAVEARVEPSSAPQKGADTPLAIRPVGPRLDAIAAWWPLAGLLAMGGGAVLLRRKVRPAMSQPVRVIGSAALGTQGALSVVEVQDADGAWKRLLVGAGGGSPRLVSDLGTVTDFGVALDRAGDANEPSEVVPIQPRLEERTALVNRVLSERTQKKRGKSTFSTVA